MGKIQNFRLKTAVVAGATGLVGEELIRQLLNDSQYAVVKAIVRRNLNISHAKLKTIKADFDHLETMKSELQGDDVFCCLGTTMAKAKSKENFRGVDYDYIVQLARITSANGNRKFLLVSALGANTSSSIFYNRVKGEAEAAIKSIVFDAVHIFRPSLLLGQRSEYRAGESASVWLYKRLSFLVPPKFKAIEASKVAHAMIHFAGKAEKGIFIHESKELQRF